MTIKSKSTYQIESILQIRGRHPSYSPTQKGFGNYKNKDFPDEAGKKRGNIKLKKLKLYLDTSVISHLFAEDTPDKMADTNKLWKNFINGKYVVCISQIFLDEIKKCAEPKQSQMIGKLQTIEFQFLEETPEIIALTNEYIRGGVLTEKSVADCSHIAHAVVHNCDVIVSWNFKHLVNFKTINKVKVVNAMNQYREISIMPPTMLLDEQEVIQ